MDMPLSFAVILPHDADSPHDDVPALGRAKIANSSKAAKIEASPTPRGYRGRLRGREKSLAESITLAAGLCSDQAAQGRCAAPPELMCVQRDGLLRKKSGARDTILIGNPRRSK
jgi:hypothetical protein